MSELYKFADMAALIKYKIACVNAYLLIWILLELTFGWFARDGHKSVSLEYYKCTCRQFDIEHDSGILIDMAMPHIKCWPLITELWRLLMAAISRWWIPPGKGELNVYFLWRKDWGKHSYGRWKPFSATFWCYFLYQFCLSFFLSLSASEQTGHKDYVTSGVTVIASCAIYGGDIILLVGQRWEHCMTGRHYVGQAALALPHF